MVALTAVHAYVDPGPAPGTDAVYPLVDGQSDAGAVIVALGVGLTVTATGSETSLHPEPLVTCTVYDPEVDVV